MALPLNVPSSGQGWVVARQLLLGCALLMVAFAGFAELLLLMPLPLWTYSLAAMLAAAGLVPTSGSRHRAARWGGLALVLVMLAILHAVPWSSRKVFLRDLSRVKPGMTEAEVRRVMEGYIEGTGWPLPHGGEGGDGASSPGELRLLDGLVFRHSELPRFNSDWGVVTFSNGVARSVEFLPD